MVADVNQGETRILAQDRQVTRLGESVFRSGLISKEALDFLCATLARMAAAYSRLDVLGIRTVATSAVRDASNQDEFVLRTNKALGTRVEIISGPEEARLIELGVTARWPRSNERTLIVDVGGGSAELIISQDGQLLDSVSKPLGAVRLSELFLKSDPAGPEELRRLHSYIGEKLAPFYKQHAAEKFDRVVATSATAGALVCAANQIPRAKRDNDDRVKASIGQIEDVFRTLAASNLDERRKFVGIGPKRAEIIVAGAAVFFDVLRLFGHRSLYYCAAGVRDGIIADLATRRNARELSQLSTEQRSVVEAMAKRYAVSLRHARHVAFLCQQLFETLHSIHQLPPTAGRLLEAAAFLHDIGHFVSGVGHHKHSAYLVSNSDLPGFTDKERCTISALCRFHRKSMPQARHVSFQMLDLESKKIVSHLIPLLRIADALDRGHEQRIKNLFAVIGEGGLSLTVESEADSDLEIWSANEAAEAFHTIYSRTLTVQRAKRQQMSETLSLKLSAPLGTGSTRI